MKCKTWAEKCGAKPFDWFGALIKRADRNDGFSKRLTSMANGWTTCACGNQCATIPRCVGGSPIDGHLRKLGYDFNNRIESTDWNTALGILVRIEARSAILIKRELKKRRK